MPTVRLATRGSPLARRQAELTAQRLFISDPACSCELVIVHTGADARIDLPIAAFAGEGVFVAEVEHAVLEGRADVAVHSAKDLPSSSPPAGLVLAAVPERADPRDAMVGSMLDHLAPGALVATGAVRRRAQLAWVRPDLGFVELRGNIATRLSKRPPGGAVVVALAALHRLGLTHRVAEVLSPTVMVPQVGQGSIALRCREGDDELLRRLAAIDDVAAHRALRAERAFLCRLGGGCDAPIGALATPAGPPGSVDEAGPLRLQAIVAAPDGHSVARLCREGDDPEELGTGVADELMAGAGASLLLSRIEGRALEGRVVEGRAVGGQ